MANLIKQHWPLNLSDVVINVLDILIDELARFSWCEMNKLTMIVYNDRYKNRCQLTEYIDAYNNYNTLLFL